MSAVSNTHKINETLILSSNIATANKTTAAATKTHNTTPASNHQHNQQHHLRHHQQSQQSPINVQQQHSAKHTTTSARLQSQQQHQRRSLIPSVSLQQQQQEQQTAVSTAAISSQGNQLQTIATVHQPSIQTTQAHNLPKTASASTQKTSATGATENHISRRNLYNLQSLKAVNNLKAPIHSIPPRYQPPPQPQSSAHPSTGILKNLNTQRLTNGLKAAYPSPFPETSGNHLNNIKYPPEIPQLSSVFIPDSFKAPTNSSRYLQHQTNQQTQLHQRLRNVNQSAPAQGIFSNGISSQQRQSAEPQQQQQQHQDMLKFVRKTDQDHPSPSTSVTSSGTGGISQTAGRLTAEQNRQLQSLINELRSLKEQNQRLMDDNQELRDLCCFLDDDRQKGRKLAREWQRFGRYTASVMRQEVAAYQNKLRQLDDKQQELITDNLELKELCLYLDEERAHIAANSLCVNCGTSTRNVLRDDGDGSSSSTNAEENIIALRNYESQLPDLHLRSTLQDQTLQYVRSLERRIQQLEEERINSNTNTTVIPTATTAVPTANIVSQQQHKQQHQQPPTTSHNQKLTQQTSALNDDSVDPISGRPEAVVRALQVLEVREQLERDRLGNLTGHTLDQMDDGEKALVREMCNVVWRKLEGSPNGPSALDTL